MNGELINKLKLACNQFYLSKYLDQPVISDKEFDTLRSEWESLSGKSVKTLVEWESKLTIENLPEEPLDKTIVEDNDFKTALEEWMADETPDVNQLYYLTPKYDGCGIKAIYKDGVLQRVQSTPDEEFGIIRTKAFWNLFPQKLDDKSITALRGEVLVDCLEYGELSRNKANGLANSEKMDDEVENEAFIRIYKVQFIDSTEYDYDRQDLALRSLPIISMKRNRPCGDGEYHDCDDIVFAPTHRLSLNTLPNKTLTVFSDGSRFQVDGVVLYSTSYSHAFKFYYTDCAITTVKDITYNQKSNGSYAAVINIDPVTLNDKYIQNVSSGGINNMIGLSDNSPGKFGIGAKVKVILANLTIPKIIEVLEESNNYNFPKCSCGYQMTEDDVYGATLKCGNKGVCSDKVNKWLKEVAEWIYYDDLFKDTCKSVKDCMHTTPEWFGYVLHIDRWDSFDKYLNNHPKDEVAGNLIRCFNNKYFPNDEFDFELGLCRFKHWVEEIYKMSDLQKSNMEINIASGYEVLNKLYNMTWDEIYHLVEDEN